MTSIQDNRIFIETVIADFIHTSLLNRMPDDAAQTIFDAPLVGCADADDVIFSQYKTVIGPDHMTPREAFAQAFGKKPEELPARLFVVSWILPVTAATRKSNRIEKSQPSRLWAFTRWYGEQFNDALRKHVVQTVTDRGYHAAAPVLQPFFRQLRKENGPYSNWSERHAAYAAGLGTFSLSDGFITEKGIAHRCGSVVTDMELRPDLRTANTAFSNCLFYYDASCKACIARCPAGAISEVGHDKNKCSEYVRTQLAKQREDLKIGNGGCGLCQVKVPCEFKNPARGKRK